MALVLRPQRCPPEGHHRDDRSGHHGNGLLLPRPLLQGVGAPQAESQPNPTGPTFEPRMLWKRGA